MKNKIKYLQFLIGLIIFMYTIGSSILRTVHVPKNTNSIMLQQSMQIAVDLNNDSPIHME